MAQAHQHLGFLHEGGERLLQFGGREAVLAHLLDGNLCAVTDIGRLIDGGHATLAYGAADDVDASQARLRGEPSSGVQGGGGRAARGAGSGVDDRCAFECIAA